VSYCNLSAVDFDCLCKTGVPDPYLRSVGVTFGVAVVDVAARVRMYSYNLEVHSLLPCEQDSGTGLVIPPVGRSCGDIHDVTFRFECVGVGRGGHDYTPSHKRNNR